MAHFRKKSDHDGAFSVESFSAFGDYIRNCPERLSFVEVGAKRLDVVKGLVRESGADIEVVASPKPEFFCAKIILSLASEPSSYSKLGRLVVCLDHIEDPRNFGAIVRSAAYFGVSDIILPKNRQVKLTQAVVDTSQAGFSVVKCIAVTNLARSIKSMKEEGYWVVGMDMDGQAIGEFPSNLGRAVLALGSESKGLSKPVRKTCDFSLRVGPRSSGIDSLNVSVAAGLGLDALLKII